MIITPERFPRYLVLAVAVLLYGLTLAFIALRLATPFDGTRIDLRAPNLEPGTVIVQPMVPEQGALQPGDQVVGVEEKSIADWTNSLFDPAARSPAWRVDQTVTYTIIRGTGTLDIPVKLGHYALDTVWQDGLAILLFVIILQGEAIWLFASKPDERLAQLLFLAGCATVTFSILFYLGMDVASFLNSKWLWLYYRLVSYGMGALVCSLMMHFALILPRLHTGPRINHWLLFFIYVIPDVLWTIYIASLYRRNILEWLRQWEPAGWSRSVVSSALW